MKLLDIAKTIGAGIFSVAVPGGAAILAGVNELLPDDKKLPAAATGADISATLSTLPPEQRAELAEKEFDVELTQIKESNATLRTMLESDAANPHTTRPYIARRSFQLIAIVTLLVVLIWSYGVVQDKTDMVKTVMDGWPFIASLVAPFVALLWAYFGILKQEHRNKLNAASNSPSVGGIAGIISSVMNRGK